eukprot:scaffold5138_cov251-Pinguiococcus_pyrenoidosus.AAC.16
MTSPKQPVLGARKLSRASRLNGMSTLLCPLDWRLSAACVRQKAMLNFHRSDAGRADTTDSPEAFRQLQQHQLYAPLPLQQELLDATDPRAPSSNGMSRASPAVAPASDAVCSEPDGFAFSGTVRFSWTAHKDLEFLRTCKQCEIWRTDRKDSGKSGRILKVQRILAASSTFKASSSEKLPSDKTLERRFWRLVDDRRAERERANISLVLVRGLEQTASRKFVVIVARCGKARDEAFNGVLVTEPGALQRESSELHGVLGDGGHARLLAAEAEQVVVGFTAGVHDLVLVEEHVPQGVEGGLRLFAVVGKRTGVMFLAEGLGPN